MAQTKEFVVGLRFETDLGQIKKSIDSLTVLSDAMVKAQKRIDDQLKVLGLSSDSASKGVDHLSDSMRDLTNESNKERNFNINADKSINTLNILNDIFPLLKIAQEEAAKATERLNTVNDKLGLGLGELAIGFIGLMAGIGQFVNSLPEAQVTSFEDAVYKANRTLGNWTRGFLNLSSLTNSAFKISMSDAGRWFSSLTTGFKSAASDFRPFSLTFIETLAVMSPLMITFGEAMQKVDNRTTQLIGTLLIFVGTLVGKVTGVITYLLKLTGDFAQSIGQELGKALERFSIVATKAEQSSREFGFTIAAFSEKVGPAVGTLEQWNEVLASVDKDTAFTTNSIRGSIKTLIGEGTTLGLTFNDNKKLLKASIDIAAVSGKGLQEVTQSLLSGLAGQTQSAMTLGINLGRTSIAHKLLSESAGVTIDKLNEQAIVQTRLSMITERANILKGASISLNDTAAGRTTRYNKILTELESKIGSVNIIQRVADESGILFLKTINSFPDEIFKVVAVLGNMGSVVLTVGGFLIKHILIISSAITLYKILNVAIGMSVIAQTLLSNVVNVATGALGLQAVSITSLSGLLIALRAIIGSIIAMGISGVINVAVSMLATLVTAVKTVIAALINFVAANAVAFAEILIIAAVVAALVQAFTELDNELGDVTDTIGGLILPIRELLIVVGLLEAKAKDTSSVWHILGTIMAFFIDVIKLAVQGILVLVNIISLAVAGVFKEFQDTFGASAQSIQRTIEAIDRLETTMGKLGISIDNTQKTFAMTREEVESLGIEIEHTQKIVDKFNMEKVAVEADKLVKANQAIAKSIALIGLDRTQTIQKNLEFDLAALDVEKQRLDTEKAFTGEVVTQIALQGELLKQKADAQISEIKKQELLSKISKVSRVTRVARAPRATIAPKVAAAPKIVLTDAQKSLNQLLAQSIPLQTQVNEYGKSDLELIKMRSAARIIELKLLMNKLRLEGNLGPAQKALIIQTSANVKKLEALGLADIQKAKLKQIADLEASTGSRLLASDQAINNLKSNRITIIKNEAMQNIASIEGERKKVLLAGNMTAQLQRNFNQLVKNQAIAAQFSIKEIKTEAIERLADETDRLNLSGLEGNERIDEQLRLQLLAIANKEEELKAAGLLTKEAEKLLNVQRELAGKGAKKTKKAGESKDEEDGFDFDALAGGIADGFEQGVDFFSGAIDSLSGLGDKQVMALTSSFESLPEQVAEGMKNLPEIFEKGINGMIDAFSTLIDKAPEMIGKILEMLPGIIDKLFAAVTKMFEAAPAILSQILDALIPMIVQILEKLPDLILTIFDSIGDMVVLLMDKIPGIIIAFAENIGPIIEALVEGLVSNVGKIVIGFIDTFIVKGGAFKIGIAIAKAMIIDLPIGILKGLAKGLESIFKSIMSGAKIDLKMPKALEEMPKKLGKELSKVAEGVKASSSNVFAVMDLEKVKSAKSIDKSIGQATKQAAAAFKNTFKTIGGWLQQLWAALKLIWDTVIMWLQKLWAIIEQIWDVVVKALQALWDVIELIWDVVVKALQILWDAIEAIWDVVVLALQGLWDAIEIIWDAVVLALQGLWDSIEKIWEDAVTAFTDAFNDLKDIVADIPTKLGEGATKILTEIQKIPGFFTTGATAIWTQIEKIPGLFTTAMNHVSSVFGQVGAKAFESVKSAFSGLGDVIKDIFKGAMDSLNPKNFLESAFKVDYKGMGDIENLLHLDFPWANFAEGGIVPGQNKVPGDNKKNDTIAALLSPGEAVIPKSAMADPQVASLINSVIGGNLKFLGKGLSTKSFKAPKMSVSLPPAPKLPSINDIKSMSPADLIKNIGDNLAALANLGFGDLWSLFKDKAQSLVIKGVEDMIKSAAHFETGGIVPADGMGMLHQNEVVLPTDLINKLLSGGDKGQSGQGQVINITANVSVNGGGDKGTGKTIVDEIFKEIRKRSANQKIMHESGLIR